MVAIAFGLARIHPVLSPSLKRASVLTGIAKSSPPSRHSCSNGTRRWSRSKTPPHHPGEEPAQLIRSDVFALEDTLSNLVNADYGLTEGEIASMWRTAPPRMPFTPAGRLNTCRRQYLSHGSGLRTQAAPGNTAVASISMQTSVEVNCAPPMVLLAGGTGKFAKKSTRASLKPS